LNRDPAQFYVTGGTLRPDSPCYVERRADQELFDGLVQGEFCYVLTARQMGKSSLMVRAANRLRGAGCRVAVLDLAAIGQNVNAEQWYNGLLGRIGLQLNCEEELDTFWLAHPHLGPLQRWLEAIREVVLNRTTATVGAGPAPGATGRHAGLDAGKRIVVFIDEIDAVRSLSFPTDDFFAAIRECYNRRAAEREFSQLTFCLLGVAAPADLIRDSRQTPFNLGKRVELSDFTPREASPLVFGFEWQGPEAPGVLRRVLYWTNGHPYLTQTLCQAVAKDAAVAGPAGVDRVCEALFLSHRAQERDDNLLFVREYLLRAQREHKEVLAVYERVLRGEKVADDPRDPVANTLRLSGVATVSVGYFRIRNKIYYRVFGRDWLAGQEGGGTVENRFEAYRSGVWRGLLIGVAAGLLLALVVRILFTPVPVAVKSAGKASNRASTSGQSSPIISAGDESAGTVPGSMDTRWPKRSPMAGTNQLDLTAYYNTPLGIPLPNAGHVQLGGVFFDGRAAVRLGRVPGSSAPPIRMREVPIGRPIERLRILHAAASGWSGTDRVVGSYILRYSNGQTLETPVFMSKDTQLYERENASQVADRLTPVWTGTLSSGRQNHVLRLYMMSLTNPMPQLSVNAIELVSASIGAEPMVVAITVEP
jgi:hypothetical protein